MDATDIRADQPPSSPAARGPAPALIATLALLSGASGLVYQVVWTREVALIIGSNVEAIVAVVAGFFAGLAAGAFVLGPYADRQPRPLRFYGILEIAAALLAAASPLLLRWGAPKLLATGATWPALAAAIVLILIVTFLLGGTLPALVRAVAGRRIATAQAAGMLVATNTAGAVAGVVVAALAIPRVGLLLTIVLAALLAIAVGAAAIFAAGAGTARLPAAHAEPRPATRAQPGFAGALGPRLLAVAVVALLAGSATLGFEVVATRLAELVLGSSLAAWATVLAVFLLGLAIGNGAMARLAATSRSPARVLAWVEIGAALTLAAAATWAVPGLAEPAAGTSATMFATVAAWLLPPTILMGAAFPLFVRLAERPGEPGAGAARTFGAISGVNTAGGLIGAALVPLVALPALGIAGSIFACGLVNALLGIALLAASGRGAQRWARPVIGAAALTAAVIAWPPAPARPSRILHVAHGPDVTAVVVRREGHRELIVNGDPEAATGGNAKETEQLLATLPVLLHRAPRDFLEIGFGAGITLDQAAKLDLATIECVEIAEAVLACAPFFSPHNDRARLDDRVRIVHGDGRAHLLRRPDSCDVVVANTLHPWSVGATGLYSREYFSRMRAALRPGGMAAQWVPLAGIDHVSLAAILRTFYSVFEDGSAWWAAENLILVGRAGTPGAESPGAPGSSSADDLVTLERRASEVLAREGAPPIDRADLASRRVGDASAVRSAVGSGTILTDDRPSLERRGRTGAAPSVETLSLVERIASAERAEEGLRPTPIAQWLRSRVARAKGETAEADRLEAVAIDEGFALARRAKARREIAAGLASIGGLSLGEAQTSLARGLDIWPNDREGLLGLALIASKRKDAVSERQFLERLVAAHPDDAEAWNALAALLARHGERELARTALERALAADPFHPLALVNAGMLALRSGRRADAESMLARLQAIDPDRTLPEHVQFAAAMGAQP